MDELNSFFLANMESIMEMSGLIEEDNITENFLDAHNLEDSDDDGSVIDEQEYLASYDQIKNTTFNKRNGYKRIRYFNKLLHDLKGINIKKIDELLLFEINCLGVDNVEDIRNHLKSLGYSQNYDCTIKIAKILGIGHQFTDEIINRLRSDFLKVKEYFERDRSLFFERHSFINYRFFIKSLLHMYGKDDLAKLIVPLKNNVEFHEKCWENVLKKVFYIDK